MTKRITEDQASRPDEENPELTRKQIRNARLASEVLPNLIGEAGFRELVNRGGRPRKPEGEVKVNKTIRFDPDVLKAYMASGPGWQSRINAVLRDHMPEGTKRR